MILHRYFGRRFLTTFLAVLGIFVLIVMLLDFVDQLRRYGNANVGLEELATLTLLNAPRTVYGMLPLIVVLSTISLFLSLARSSELVVTRASGQSALRALAAPVAAVLVIGILGVAVGNPIVAGTSRLYEQRRDAIQGVSQVLALGSSGLWLRQGDGRQQTVIRAETANLDGTVLSGVTFLTFDSSGAPTRRIEAAQAALSSEGWQLLHAKVWPLTGAGPAEAQARLFDTLPVRSSLTADQIRDSFGTPSSIPIWELPRFIARLQAAGFSAQRHQVWLQGELALPVFLVSMVTIGAAFTMRPQRGGHTGFMVINAILLAFSVYFLRNFVQILGENGQLPAILSAWAPPFAAIGLSVGYLLHEEDG